MLDIKYFFMYNSGRCNFFFLSTMTMENMNHVVSQKV